MGFLASPETMVLPDQKMAFMINRTVASFGAVKFKSITKEGAIRQEVNKGEKKIVLSGG